MTGGNRALPLALLGAVLVAGCGGGAGTPAASVTSGTSGSATTSGGSTAAIDRFNALNTNYNAVWDQVPGDPVGTGMTHTSPANMPTIGGATFNGYAKVQAVTPDGTKASAIYEGEAVVNADFQNDTLNGTVSNVMGGTLDTTKVRTFNGDPQDYSGVLSLSGGCIGPTACKGAVANPYEARATLTGTLTSPAHSVTVSVPMQGTIYGNPAPKGILIDSTNAGTTGTVTIDGKSSIGVAAVVGAK